MPHNLFRMSSILVFGIGFSAQLLFFARTILQWVKSEHEGEVISPVIFWQLSLIASILMLTYGILRNDFAIILGQILVYYIYVRNLQLKNAWKPIPPFIKFIGMLLPLIIVFWLFTGNTNNFSKIIRNDEISNHLMLWGSAGQIVFTSRFIYQWTFSEKEKESILPLGFWILSLIGSAMIFLYSIYRLDPVLFLAHTLGIFIYIMNILLSCGKRGLFSRLNLSFLNSFTKKLSDKLH